MTNRIPIGKTVRFEVFKRDKFICQYCGNQAPNVVLEIDHITPASKEGTNDILNLITSCYDCNRGKRNVKLDDDSAINKQRVQLELLQDRREQIELMFQWKDSLSKLDDDVVLMVKDYIDKKIGGFSVSEHGIKTIKDLIKKFELADILEAIDVSEKNYLKYDREGKIDAASVGEFFNKIGGIVFNKNRTPLQQKLSYVKGICRNRFSYWDNRKGSAILNSYIEALRNFGWSDDQIMEDIDKELIPKIKQCKHWTQWRELLEKWTNDINGWNSNSAADKVYTEINESDLDRYAEYLLDAQKLFLPALNYIGKEFKSFDESKIEDNFERFIKVLVQSLIEDSIFTAEKWNDFKTGGDLDAIMEHSGLIHLKINYEDKDNLNLQRGLWRTAHSLISGYIIDFINVMFLEYEFTSQKYLEVILFKYQNLKDKIKTSNT